MMIVLAGGAHLLARAALTEAVEERTCADTVTIRGFEVAQPTKTQHSNFVKSRAVGNVVGW